MGNNIYNRKKYRFSKLSTDWVLLNLDITDDNYGIKLFYDQIESVLMLICVFQI